MNFIEAIKFCIDNSYADFKSRASRSQFWYFTIFMIIYVIAGSFILNLIIKDWMKIQDQELLSSVFYFGYLILIAPVFIPALSVTVRRLHDINFSGWYVGLYFAISYLDIFFDTKYIFYLVSTVIFYSICSLKGTDGNNRFGNKPLK